MTNKEAKDFLTHYICSCPYGTSPANCGDKECKFGMAIRTLCVEERPTGHWEYIQTDGYGHKTGYCSLCGVKNRAVNFCGNCGADMRVSGDTE